MPKTELSDDQFEAIKQLICGAGGGYDFDFLVSEFFQNGWKIHPVYVGDRVAGGIMQKGADIHTSIAPEFQKKWNPRPYINKILYPALEEYGEVKSLAPKSDNRCLKWLTKLGFEITEEDNDFFYLKLSSTRFKK